MGNNGFDYTGIAKLDGACSPFKWNIAENTGLFYTSSDQGQSVICDVKNKFKIFGKWNEQLVVSKYKLKGNNKVKGGSWWNYSQKPDTIEGIFLHYYENDTKLFVISVGKNSMEGETSWQDECKQVYDLNSLVCGDLGYFESADPDETITALKRDLEISAVAWKDDLCCIGHGGGKITILRARVNHGGIAFQYIRILSFEAMAPIIDITIFNSRQVAITLEPGIFQ